MSWRGILSAGHTVPLWRFRILLSFDELLLLRLSRHPIPLAVCLSKSQLWHILVTRWYHMIENECYLLLESGRYSIICQKTILLHPVTFWSPRKKHNPMWFCKPPTTTNHRANYGDTPDTDTVVPPSRRNDTSFDCVWSCSMVCRGRPYLQKNSRLKWWVNFALFNVYMNFLSVVISS